MDSGEGLNHEPWPDRWFSKGTELSPSVHYKLMHEQKWHGVQSKGVGHRSQRSWVLGGNIFSNSGSHISHHSGASTNRVTNLRLLTYGCKGNRMEDNNGITAVYDGECFDIPTPHTRSGKLCSHRNASSGQYIAINHWSDHYRAQRPT